MNWILNFALAFAFFFNSSMVLAKKISKKSSATCRFEEIKLNSHLSRDGKFVFPSKKSVSVVAQQNSQDFDVFLLSDLGQKKCTWKSGEIKKVYLAEKAKKIVLLENSGLARALQLDTCEELGSSQVGESVQFKNCQIANLGSQ